MPETTTHWRDAGPLRPEDPRQVAGFEVVGRLGAGGMGVVYLAQHPTMGPAAVKLVREGAADAAFRDRFRREVEVAQRVASPRVARVLAADPDGATPWLATAFVDGPTLQEAIEADGPMGGDRLVALAVALADALAAIHRAGVVHRDLKPSNILLTAETPVVIDFGIAALREAPGLTRTGLVVGTPGWMAPEQVRGQGCGPPADVFTWALVVAFAASGTLPFGRGAADAVFYRIVHEDPAIPALPPPLDRVVGDALAKDPDQRPSVAHLLATLTEPATQVSTSGSATTAIGPTLADRTAVVPTIVALGWGVDALPARPGGRPRSVDLDQRPPPPPPSGPGFWFLGREHHDAASLAAAFQTGWDDAIAQLFHRRDPVWLGELQAFLRARGLAEADRIVTAGTGPAPPAATMAQLLTAIHPDIEPRVGDWWLTPDGLVVAAQDVLDGRGSAERLAAVGAGHVLRLWRTRPGMDRAAAIDEQWHAAVRAFDRLVVEVAPHAGYPSPADRHRAMAELLQCAVHPDHERRLERRLAAARRTAARHQRWWSRLAAEGGRSPAAAVLAVMTADHARGLARDERQAARQSAKQRRAVERVQRDHRRQAAKDVVAPYRFVPLPRAQSAVRRPWILVVMLAVLVAFLWAAGTFGDDVEAHYQALDRDGIAENDLAAEDGLDRYRDAASATGLAVVLLVALPAAHAVTRSVVRQGTDRPMVRLYAGGAAVVDLLLALALMAAAGVAALVLGVGLDGSDPTSLSQPFGDQPWAAVAVLLPFGPVGAVLAIRSCWRLGRAVFGRPVAGPLVAPTAPMPG